MATVIAAPGNVPVRPRALDHRAITAWASRHYGVITRAKLISLGLSRGRIDAQVAKGWLLPVAAGVYVVGHRAEVPGQREALAVAAAGPGAVLSGRSAATWHDMIEPASGPVHLIARRARYRPRAGAVRHVDALDPGDVTVVRGLPCVTPARAVMDLPRPQLRQALQWMVRRGMAIEPIVERMRGRRGAKAFREEVAQLIPQMAHSMSELENRFLRLCRECEMPIPVVNGTLAGGDLLDCAWPDNALVVELDGRRWHEHRDREDRARDRRRMLEGRLPFRYGWPEITSQERATGRELLAAFAAGKR